MPTVDVNPMPLQLNRYIEAQGRLVTKSVTHRSLVAQLPGPSWGWVATTAAAVQARGNAC